MKEIEKMSNANEQRWAAVQRKNILKETGHRLTVLGHCLLADGIHIIPDNPEADYLVIRAGIVAVFGWKQGQWGFQYEFDSLQVSHELRYPAEAWIGFRDIAQGK
jgi:hypothetical protein